MPDYLVELEDGRKFRVKSKTPLSEEEVTSYALGQQTPADAPAADQPGRLGSFASNVGRGALSVIPGTVGGVGYALGSDTLTGAADTIEGGINRMLPVNPEYQDELLMKGGQAVGQAIGMLGTGGAVGAAGKSLALSRGLAQGAAAAKGADLARNVMLGTGIAQGTRGGGQAAEQYGMQGGAAYARALLGGAIEGASERYLFGMGTELAPVKKFLGEAAEKGVGGIVKSVGTEAGEEAVSQIGGNVATSVLAPYGVQTPGVLEGVGESALLGGIAGGTIGGINALMQPSPTIEGDALFPPEQAPPPVEEPEDDYGVAAFQQQMTEIAAQPDPIAPIQQTVTAAAENSVRVNANVLPATAAVIEAGGLAPAPIVEQPRTREEEIAQMRAMLRLNLSAEEREDMEQQLAQAQAEGAAADQTAEERRQAIQREDIIRRQQDREAELQRLAEERQRATAREQQRQQPPVAEETVAPIQPVPVVEETGAPEITPEQVPNVENVIDEPGAAEVGLGMAKKAKSFKDELEMSGVAYLNGDRWGIKQSSDGTFYVEQTVNGERKIVASNFPDIEAAQGGAISAAFPSAVESTGTPVKADPTLEEGRIPRDEAPAQDNTPTDKALVKPVIRRTGSKVAGASVAGQKSAAFNALNISTLRMLNDKVGAYPNEDFNSIDPAQINEVMDYMISLQLPQPAAPAPTVQRDVTKPEQMTPEEFASGSKQASDVTINVQKTRAEAQESLDSWVDSRKDRDAFKKITNTYGVPLSGMYEVVQISKRKWAAGPTHQHLVILATTDNKPVSAAAIDAYKITLPEGYVRQGDLYVFQPSGTVGTVKGDAAIKAAKKQAQEIEKLKREGKIKPEDESYWSTPVEGQPKDPIPDVKDTNGIQINEGDVVEFSGVLGGKGTGKVRWVGPYIANASGELQPGFWSANGVLRANGAPLTIIERDGEPISPPTIETPTKPKNMAGEVRPERAKPTPAPEFTTLHPKTQEKFNTAFEAKDAGAMNSLLDPTNKGSRAEFERRTGVKLPTTQKGTRDSVETWAAKTPVADLTDTELDRDLLRLGEYSKKTYASDALKARALELAKEFQKRQDVAATDKAAGEASARKKAIAKKALAATDGRGTVGNLAGDSLAQVRADLLSEITGTKVPKSKAGINALMKAFYQEFGIATDIEAGMQKKLAQALQDAVTETAPQPKPAAEVETPVAGVPVKLDAKEAEAIYSNLAKTKVVKLTEEIADIKKGKNNPKSPWYGAKTFETDKRLREIEQLQSPIMADWGLVIDGLDAKIAKREPLTEAWDELLTQLRLPNEFKARVKKAGYVKQGDRYVFQSGITSEFGSTNTVVTKEAKDQAAKSLRESLGQTNVGLNPATLKYAITVGTYYLEGGVRSFADFSAKMVEEFGEGVRKYLQPAYEALRKRTDIDTTGMDPVEGVETAPVAEAPTAPAAAPAARVEAETPKAAPTQATPKPATESFPTEIKLTEQPERPQASVVPPDNKPVGFSNAEMDAEAARIVGRELVRPVQEAISDDALWAQATAEFKRDSDSGRRLVTSLVATPRVVNSKEQAMLGMELVRRKNVLNAAATKFLASPEGDVGAKSEYETAQRDYDDALYANSIAGSDIGRALRFRRLTANMDMELESMLSNLKAVGNKADISKEQVAEASKIAKEYEANAKAVDALRKQAESTEADRLAEAEKVAFEAGRQAVLKDIEERAKNEAERVAEMQKRKAEYLAAKKEAAKTPSKWEEIRAAARARNAELRSNIYSDVVLVKAASMAVNDVIIGATYIAEGVTKFADWVSKMRSEDINLTDDEMQQLFKESKAFDAGEDLPASEAPLKVKKAKAPAIDKVKAIAADEEALDSRTVYNLVVEKMKARVEANPALEKVEMSADDLTSIIGEVTADVQEFFPGITEREIRDLFSGYGKILMPSKEELAKQMRQLTALGRLNSAIEDAIAGLAPLKSGPQRDKATQAIRLQQKKLARELRMMGRDYEAGEEQLRSPLDAIKARLNNQIDDLAMEINTRKKAPRRPSVDYDKDTQELADLRDELKRISDFINAPAGPTLEETVKDEMDKLDTRIKELQKLIAEGQLKPKEDTLLHTAELDAKREVRDGLNRTLQKMRKEAADKLRTQEDIDEEAIKSLEGSIAELKDKIKKADYTLPQRRTPTQTAAYKSLVKEKEDLQKKVREEREKLFGRKGMTDEQRVKQATAAVDKSIERMQNMLTSGNYDVPKRTSKTPETPELAQKRETRDKLRKQLLELRKLKRDALIDPIAKQLKTDKKRIQTRMDKLKKRMETGDFSKPEKREKPTDPELLELLAKEEKLKERWGEMLLNHKLSQRSRAKRYWDNVFDLFSMGRFLKASTDLSAIANQGNFALFSHPVLSMRQLGGMWKAMQSDTNQKIINAKIRELPEYKSGEMKRAGLYLSLDAGPNDPLQRQEEAMASRWVDKIPKRYGGGILRATSRAYTTYLDLIRVATYLSLKNNLVEGGWFMQPQETTPERLQSVANLINNGTGRGSLGSGRFGAGMSQAAPFLNTFLFAPRFGVSRFAMALGIPLWTASKGTKVLIAKEYTKYLAGLTTAMILYSMFQDEDDKEMEFDPTSSDFGKVLFDNQRVDVMGGFQQPLVFLLRLLFGEYKNSKGLIKPLREGDRPLNLFRETPLTDKPKFTDRSGAVVVGDFLRYKLSPTASLLLNTIQGKTPVGERTDLMSEVITMPVPLIIDQMYETAKAQQDDPFMAALLMGSGVAGVRTSNQDPKEDRSKAKTAWEQLIEYTKYYSGVK